MPTYAGANTNFQINGVDIGNSLVTKEYFIDVYPSLADQYKTAGLWTWGIGGSGLGTEDGFDRSSPVQTLVAGTNWKQVSIGSGFGGGIKTNGTLWMWGDDTIGALGDNVSGMARGSPAQTISAGTNWKQVACGYYHTTAIKTDGTLWGWGYNSSGQLGINTIGHRSSPIQTAAGGTNWKQVSAGGAHTSATKTDGTLWLWGDNTYGTLGTNNLTNRSSPVQTVSGGTNWSSTAAGYSHTAAIKTDGTLWSWGDNAYGQLGDNSITPRSSPVQTISAGTNWKQVACGYYVTAAIKTDGTLWLWGDNGYGGLGDNTITHRSSPVQTISGGSNWKQISLGLAHSYSLKTDGTLWGWGLNNFGQLGRGSNANIMFSSPVQTVAGGTNWKQVAAGANQITAAIRDTSDDSI